MNILSRMREYQFSYDGTVKIRKRGNYSIRLCFSDATNYYPTSVDVELWDDIAKTILFYISIKTTGHIEHSRWDRERNRQGLLNLDEGRILEIFEEGELIRMIKP